MNEQMMKERIQQALNAQMSGVRTSPAERSRMYENAIGGTKVKRKMTVGLVFAIVLVLMTAAAVAAILLTNGLSIPSWPASITGSPACMASSAV